MLFDTSFKSLIEGAMQFNGLKNDIFI